MKRILLIVVLISLFIFNGCYSINYSVSDDSHIFYGLSEIMIDSYDEYNKVLECNDEDKYNEEFFYNNNLVVLKCERSSSTKLIVKSVKVSEEKLVIDIKEKLINWFDSVATSDAIECIILIEVSKDDVKNVKEIIANVK